MVQEVKNEENKQNLVKKMLSREHGQNIVCRQSINIILRICIHYKNNNLYLVQCNQDEPAENKLNISPISLHCYYQNISCYRTDFLQLYHPVQHRARKPIPTIHWNGKIPHQIPLKILRKFVFEKGVAGFGFYNSNLWLLLVVP